MELAHPAGAESLAPQPSQLASAVASTEKSLLANFAQPRWPSPAESECHPGCQKDLKSPQDHGLPASVIGRADGRSPNNCKCSQILLPFAKIQVIRVADPLIQPSSR